MYVLMMFRMLLFLLRLLQGSFSHDYGPFQICLACADDISLTWELHASSRPAGTVRALFAGFQPSEVLYSPLLSVRFQILCLVSDAL